MLIYLRHGDDRGTDIYRHDRRLNDRGVHDASKKARRLIKEHGHPDVVYVSPYRRAIDTLHAMTKRFERPVAVRTDSRIAQYLGRRPEPKISPETASQVSVAEDAEAFRGRVAEHVAEMKRLSGVLWCITHQIVIEEVARCFRIKIPEEMDFLDHIVTVG